MQTLDALINAVYYVLVAWIVIAIVRNFIRARSWERELLYILVLVPFVLRLWRLK
jgi:hypothetical protein